LTPRERIAATLRGAPSDRTPIALWRHFPGADLDSATLADAVAAFQAQYAFDLVKVTFASGFFAEGWGAVMESWDHPEGTRRYPIRLVQEPVDWALVGPLEAEAFHREIQAIRGVRERVGPDIHVLPTVFSPLSIAREMAGDAVIEHLRTDPDAVHAALRALATTAADFTAACLDAGADGVFFATQLARRDRLTDVEYETFGVPYDLQVLAAGRGRGPLLLHLHGQEPMFELADRYDADIVNWHDRQTPPSLADGHRRSGRVVLGGIDQALLAHGDPAQVADQVRQAVHALDQAGAPSSGDNGAGMGAGRGEGKGAGRGEGKGAGLIVGTGCVALVTTPEANLTAAREAVE
jgi:uroporphyrinogen decarboxylase